MIYHGGYQKNHLKLKQTKTWLRSHAMVPASILLAEWICSKDLSATEEIMKRIRVEQRVQSVITMILC